MSGTTPSGTIASPAAPPAPARGTLGTPVTLVIVAATLLALLLRGYQLSRPGFLLSVNEYDDGPYFGSAVRLVLQGALPYRDFLIVQPPGITLLMVPAALLSKVTGTAWGMATGRILTSIAGAASVAPAGLLVRHRGLLATVIVCGMLAVYPESIQAAKTVLVEPWLVLFCLLGALAVFEGDHVTASTRRLVWGGAGFGFGGAVEPWAVFPVLVIAVLAVRRPRHLAAYIGGVAAGFGVPVLPFAALAPGKFLAATIVAQIGPRAGATRTSFWERVQDMTGLADVRSPAHLIDLAAAVAIIAVVFGGLGLAFLLTWRPPPALDAFAVGSASLVVVAFLWPSQFHYHFAAFLAPFLAMAIALPVAALVSGLTLNSGGAAGRALLQCGGASLAGLAILVMAAAQFGWETHNTPHMPLWVTAKARSMIPPGACLLADEVSFSIMTDRLVSDVPGCSLLLDATGSNYALSHGRDAETGAARYQAVDAVWTYAFHHAQYVWLSRLNGHRVAWTPALSGYFLAHFTEILSGGYAGALYRRTGLKPGT